jgi:hypothetical protein
MAPTKITKDGDKYQITRTWQRAVYEPVGEQGYLKGELTTRVLEQVQSTTAYQKVDKPSGEPPLLEKATPNDPVVTLKVVDANFEFETLYLAREKDQPLERELPPVEALPLTAAEVLRNEMRAARWQQQVDN